MISKQRGGRPHVVELDAKRFLHMVRRCSHLGPPRRHLLDQAWCSAWLERNDWWQKWCRNNTMVAFLRDVKIRTFQRRTVQREAEKPDRTYAWMERSKRCWHRVQYTCTNAKICVLRKVTCTELITVSCYMWNIIINGVFALWKSNKYIVVLNTVQGALI